MSGTQFDPRAVDAFLQEEDTLRDMVAVKCALAAPPPARWVGEVERHDRSHQGD